MGYPALNAMAGWGWGNDWGGNDWKRKRDSEPTWKNNEHLDDADCGGAMLSYTAIHAGMCLLVYVNTLHVQ